MKVMMTGSSGFIGTALTKHLKAQGIDVVPVSHQTLEVVEGCAALINLMGVSIAQRWTPKAKKAIFVSRVDKTRALIEKLNTLSTPPPLFLSASAIGIYGSGFLAQVAKTWEGAAHTYRHGRVITMRFGTILDPSGGALKTLLIPFRLGLGGRLGSGRQKLSWVTLSDLVQNIASLLDTDNMIGAVNLVSPQVVDNETLVRSLSSVLHRPALLPVPAWLLRLVLGEMADMLLEDSASNSDYGSYEHSEIHSTLQTLLK